jgi:hypothetical protein
VNLPKSGFQDASTNPAKEAQRHRPESALNGQALPTPAKGIVLLNTHNAANARKSARANMFDIPITKKPDDADGVLSSATSEFSILSTR